VVEELADQSRNVVEELAEYTFTDEQEQLRSAVRRFCAENFDEATVRRLMESDPPFDPKAWTRLGTELGVLGLSVPEADGGVGGTLIDQGVDAAGHREPAYAELGAALACGPFFGTVYLAIPALVAASPGPVRDEVLAALVEGRRTAAFAVRDLAGALDSTVHVAATATGDAWTLTGTVERVVDAGAADDLLVAAAGADGLGLYVVDAGAAGVSRTPLLTVDPTRPQATVSLTDASARRVAGPSEAPRVMSHALQVGSVLLAVEQVGAAQHILDVAVQYARERLQFGRPIGSFQAVKHRLADMMVDLEHARSTAQHAVWALTDGSDDPVLVASIAQATCSAAFSRVATDAIQTLGGIGFTWEHKAHLYFKRAITDAALLGSAEQHRSRIAELVLDTASTDKPPRVADGTRG
jgi:alkylation response protein AidB-like acyl-CoA dehydrogenase